MKMKPSDKDNKPEPKSKPKYVPLGEALKSGAIDLSKLNKLKLKTGQDVQARDS
jgi:hypothetical protein